VKTGSFLTKAGQTTTVRGGPACGALADAGLADLKQFPLEGMACFLPEILSQQISLPQVKNTHQPSAKTHNTIISIPL